MLLKRLDELLVFKTNQVTCLDIQKECKIYYMTGIHKYLLCSKNKAQTYLETFLHENIQWWQEMCRRLKLVWDSMVQLLLLIGIIWFGIQSFNCFYGKSAVILLNHPFYSRRRTHIDILPSNLKVSRSCKNQPLGIFTHLPFRMQPRSENRSSFTLGISLH